MSQNNILDKVKIILDDDTIKDELLNIYIDNATDFILNYTNLKEIPQTLNSTIVEMTVFQYGQRGLENVKSESIGAMSYSFVEGYPSNITDRFNSYRQITVV